MRHSEGSMTGPWIYTFWKRAKASWFDLLGTDYKAKPDLNFAQLDGLEHRFFARIFFVFREDVSGGSGGGSEEAGVGDLPEFDSGGHGSAAGKGDTPAAGMRNFGDQRVGVKAPEEARDLSRLFLGFCCQRIQGLRQFLTHITVGKTVQRVFAGQEHLKQHSLVARQRVECLGRPAVFGRRVGRQRIEIPHRRGGVLHLA